MPKKVFELEFEGKLFKAEIGELAKQADGAALIRYNDSTILSTVCCSDKPKEGDFFPLTVEYMEKQYAAGRIPGSFLRREGRGSEHATLTARMIDRPIRPMFSDGFRNEVQIINTVLSADPDAPSEMAAMLGSSLALGISNIPFDGPIAGVNVGRVDGKFVINPNTEERLVSDLDLTVAGTEEAINMVEAGSMELDEDTMLDALMFGHEAIKKLCQWQKEIIAEVGKEKREIKLFLPEESLVEEMHTRAYGDLKAAVSIFDKLERQKAIDKLGEEIVAEYTAREDIPSENKGKVVSDVKAIYETMIANEVRRLITEEKIRPDGRKVDEVRPLNAQVDILPRVHGSALFTRGQTQVLSIVTLGAKSDEQLIDDLTDETSRRFMHQYNFPPFSVGDIKKVGSPGRREIGHGHLGERALSYVIPSEESFPYTIRVVSEVLESNGSSSQASICAASMALMAAGVPIKDMVTGIAMGLITSGPLDGKHPYTILTDIQGLEDHFGDMDFKVAGTPKGITALQMDIKIKGVTKEILREALAQAHKARAEIRAVQMGAISEPREDVAEYAPKMETFTIDPDKIREVIGTGGKVINDIIAQCDNCKIDIEDDGRVTIYHMNRETIKKARTMIDNIVRVAKVGEVYEGVVNRVEDYGCFVNLFGEVDGLCHVSRLAWTRTENPRDVVKIGQKLKVIVTEIDEKGKVKVSHREFTEKPADYVEPVAKEENSGPRKGFKKFGHRRD
ncbi:MAG: polyribonucleotide nucleotidyltransferase [Bacilli bacterium]|jgi:polyribonucleotide nucleotidyltransferase|nr:polyribonucleotide nucleotidyltransferase [Bacilli bacterium]MCH4202304.1 polyribonucleotide nucleotidyltransferase [Bacilli bacterium]MCH4235283.1 polyribonucleotide nucleotidyltransferase [Bacilli bacterium]